MDQDLRDSLIGAAVLALGLVLIVSNMASRDVRGTDGYPLTAVFSRADGLGVGSEVRLAGIVVGRVVGQALNAEFQAVVSMSVESGIEVPTDSAAMIQTDGIFGEKYVELVPGGALETLPPGGRVEYTQGSVVIEELLAKVIERAKAMRGIEGPADGF